MATGIGTGKAGRLGVFPPTIVRAERGASTGGLGSTAGPPGTGKRAEDIDVGEQKVRGRKAKKMKDERRDGIAMGTKKGAGAIEAESELKEGIISSYKGLKLQTGKQFSLFLDSNFF